MTERVGAHPELLELARRNGVETSYVDTAGHRRHANVDSVLAVLGALGVMETGWPSLADVPDALRASLALHGRRTLPPVVVAWDGGPVRVGLRLPAALAEARIAGWLGPVGASGTERRRIAWAEEPSPPRFVRHDGASHARRFVTLPGGVARGHHELEIEVGSVHARCRLISAPRRLPDDGGARDWGLFAPLYALRSARDWGVGDLRELGRLAHRTGELGGRFVGTLPLLASHPRALGSPYTPLSRLFWNEIFFDVEAVPEARTSTEARGILESPDFQRERERARNASLVDYAAVARLKRRVLSAMHRSLRRAGGRRRDALERWSRDRPELVRFASFVACLEETGAPPPRSSPNRHVEGHDSDAPSFHRYVQWIAQAQIDDVARSAASVGVDLYLDLPLGVHPEGFDVWDRPASFVGGLSTGAPPDAFFRDGQNWGFPPPHPRGVREEGYDYVRASLRHHLRAAKLLRIDHVMALHHLYVVPPGADASDGVYLRYRPDELYAVLSLEAHRAGAAIVGEDLGTVPESVRTALDRHGLKRMYVLPFELDAAGEEGLAPVPADALASLGTHDTPTFAGLWTGADIEGRAGTNPAAERRERERWRSALVRELVARGLLDAERRPTPEGVLEACLAFLAASPASHVLVTLEDLWLEPRPQNVPGTTEAEQPNWRRKTEPTLDDALDREGVTAALERVRRLRREPRLESPPREGEVSR